MSSPSEPLRVALVGCGQIADAHLSQLRRVRLARTVAVCDVYEDLAWQAAKRFDVPASYTDLQRMLLETRPDVVHVTTPAHTHAALAKSCLRAGCHVYVEKPFTLHAAEADDVLNEAQRAERSLCLGHDQLFDPAWIRCRELVDAGGVGDVRHVESVLGYPISGSFGRQVTADPHHWVHRLPGGLLQNTISHPLYRITEFLVDDRPQLLGGWHTRAPFTFPTELNVTFIGRQVTGSLVFSTSIAPQRITRVYGTSGTLEVDLDAQLVRRWKRPTMPGAFAKLQSPFSQWADLGSSLVRNLWRFAKADIHYFAGMKTLFEQFYRSILDKGEPPVPTTQARRVTALMDEIFTHCRRGEQSQAAPAGGVQLRELAACP